MSTLRETVEQLAADVADLKTKGVSVDLSSVTSKLDALGSAVAAVSAEIVAPAPTAAPAPTPTPAA